MYPWILLLFMLMLSLMSRHNGPPLFFFPLLKAVSSFPFMHSVRKVVSVPCVDGFLFFFIAIVVVSSFSTFLEFLPITRLRNYLAVFPIFTFSWLVWVCIIVRGAWENRMTLASFLFFYWGHLDGLSWGLRAEVSTIDSRWGGLGTQYHMHVIITSICLLSAVRWVCWSRVLAFGSCSVDTRSTIFLTGPLLQRVTKLYDHVILTRHVLYRGRTHVPWHTSAIRKSLSRIVFSQTLKHAQWRLNPFSIQNTDPRHDEFLLLVISDTLLKTSLELLTPRFVSLQLGWSSRCENWYSSSCWIIWLRSFSCWLKLFFLTYSLGGLGLRVWNGTMKVVGRRWTASQLYALEE